MRCAYCTLRAVIPQAESTQYAIGQSALRRNGNGADRHADQDALQRIVGMPSREPGDGTKEKHHHAEKQQHGVNREICRTQPIVLACMGELVRQEPSPMLGEQRRFHDDDVPDGDGSPSLETFGGQTVEPRARSLGRRCVAVSGNPAAGPWRARSGWWARSRPGVWRRLRHPFWQPGSRCESKGRCPAGFQKSGLSACGTAEFFPGYHRVLSAQTSSCGSSMARRSVTVADHGMV